MARDTPAQKRRKAAASYVPTGKREGCRTCAFSEFKFYENDTRTIKAYYCRMGTFFTTSTAICEKYVKKETP